MHESVSYSFLLNIIILFVFVCGAIISGIFSYYRAFRANTIIVNEIEKYEGYNCLSRNSIAKKLSSINYNVPFNVKCKSSDKNCMTDDKDNGNYAIVSYNLDYDGGDYAFAYTDDKKNNDLFYKMNSKVSTSDSYYTKMYQYGVYTYMYVDLPVVSQLLKLSFFSKTKIMYEFRNLNSVYLSDNAHESDEKSSLDMNLIPEDIKGNINENTYALEYAIRGVANYTSKTLAHKEYIYGYDPDVWGYGRVIDVNYNLREAFRYYFASDVSYSQYFVVNGRFACGEMFDWSVY